MSDAPRRFVPVSTSIYASELKTLAHKCDGKDRAYCETLAKIHPPGQLLWIASTTVERLRNPLAPVTKVEPLVEPPADVNASVDIALEEPPTNGDDV